MDFFTARSTVQKFGRRVRACRLAAGLSQPELGRLARVTPKFIGEIERGSSNPSLVTMALVANALGCGLVDLLHADKSAAYVSLSADNARRVHDAATIIASVLSPRKRARRNAP
jgi:transcriptional regulator with XRE-family HTH domain